MTLDFKGRPTSQGTQLALTSELSGAGNNFIINGEFAITQLGTSHTSTDLFPNNDNAYVFDCWRVLSNGNDIVDVTQSGTGLGGSSYSVGLDVETANQKFGIFQVIEFVETRKFQGRPASYTFKIRNSGGASLTGNIRAALVEWTSTANATTGDPISAWNSTGVDPTLASNWAYVSGSQVTVSDITTAVQEIKVENVTISNSANNLALFIWNNSTSTTVADFLFLSSIGLAQAASIQAYTPVPLGLDFLRAQRFIQKTFSHTVAPGNNVSSAVGDLRGSWTNATNVPSLRWGFSTPMLTAPTIFTYNFRSGGAAGQWTNGSADLANARIIQQNEFGAGVDNTSTAVTASSQWFIGALAIAVI